MEPEKQPGDDASKSLIYYNREKMHLKNKLFNLML